VFRPLFVLLGCAATVAGVVAVRGKELTWGAERDEASGSMPGDDIVAEPQYAATNAVAIDAPASAVWPWLVQMGAYTRAGWYAFDRLDNGGVPSAPRIVAELQHLQVGDVMPTDRDGNGFLVEAIEPNRSIVLTIRDPDTITSSVMVLKPTANDKCRLLIRLRLRGRANLRGFRYRAVMELGHVPMTLRMLHRIRDHAEAAC
jgi:hypothetical protein